MAVQHCGGVVPLNSTGAQTGEGGGTSKSFLSGHCHCEHWVNVTSFHCILLKQTPISLH